MVIEPSHQTEKMLHFRTDILQPTFGTSIVTPRVEPTRTTVEMPWEQWVRTFLGHYLDILPYGRFGFSLEDYMEDMVERVANDLHPSNQQNVDAFRIAFRDALPRFFPDTHMPTHADVRAFLEANSAAEEELKALGMVYAYHRRRAGAQAEELQIVWSQDAVAALSVAPTPVDPVPTAERLATILQTQTAKYEVEEQRRDDFIRRVQTLGSYAFRWSMQEIKEALMALEGDWQRLDPYARKDLEPLYNYAQQYNKTI
jgi:hypothetical protein